MKVVCVAFMAVALLAVPGCPKPQPPAEVEMVLVQGGTFWLGAVDGDAEARVCERPRHSVTVSSFYMDTTEVTLAHYEEAVAAGVVPEASCPTRYDDESWLCNWGRKDRRDHPANGISWSEADAYCRSKDKRLPTEAEFEYVLRDGNHDAIYPWGDSRIPPARYANVVGEETQNSYSRWEHIPGFVDEHVGTSPVGAYAPNSYGLHDISGNVWEWCSDWYGVRSYPEAPQTDPTGPASGEHKILRGGGFHCVLTELRSAERHHKPADNDSFYSGFRCARDADE
jgi:formylglycine-generating enzyme